MKTYDSAQAPKFRAILETRAAELRAILSHEADAAHADTARETLGFADDALRVAESEVDANQAAHAAVELQEVDAALRRLDDGTYGLCADCGDAIDLRRLEAIPAAAHCTDCQAAHEH